LYIIIIIITNIIRWYAQSCWDDGSQHCWKCMTKRWWGPYRSYQYVDQQKLSCCWYGRTMLHKSKSKKFSRKNYERSGRRQSWAGT